MSERVRVSARIIVRAKYVNAKSGRKRSEQAEEAKIETNLLDGHTQNRKYRC